MNFCAIFSFPLQFHLYVLNLCLLKELHYMFSQIRQMHLITARVLYLSLVDSSFGGQDRNAPNKARNELTLPFHLYPSVSSTALMYR